MPEIEFDNQSKTNILLHALEERYKAQHTIRERIQNICLWTLGIFLTAGGWLIQSQKVLLLGQKILFSILVIGAVLVLRLFYLADLQRGFKSQQRVGAQLEKRLKLFDKDLWGAPDQSVYPSEWQHSGMDNGEGKFLNTNYLLLYTGAVLLLLVIWLSGCLK